MGSWKGRGNQYIQLVEVLYCKLPTTGKQLAAFPLEVGLGLLLSEVCMRPFDTVVKPPLPSASCGNCKMFEISVSETRRNANMHG